MSAFKRQVSVALATWGLRQCGWFTVQTVCYVFFEFYVVFMIGFIFMFMELRCLKVKKGCVIVN